MALGVVGSRSLVPTAIEGWCVCGGVVSECRPWLTGSGWESDLEALQIRFSVLPALVQPRALGINQLIQGEERREEGWSSGYGQAPSRTCVCVYVHVCLHLSVCMCTCACI